MKRFFTSTWLLVSLAIVVCAPALNMVASSTANAGSPALQQLVDDIQNNCKDMSQGSETWKDCEDKQNKLVLFANCSESMFGPKDSNGKRNFVKSKLDSCQKKINSKTVVPGNSQKLLDEVVDSCNGIETGKINPSNTPLIGGLAQKWVKFVNGIAGGVNSWEDCEAVQGILKTIGCGNLYEEVDGGPLTKKYDTDQVAIDECQSVINKIKTSPDTKPGGGADPSEVAGSSAGDDIPCRGGAMGWIMCPLIEIMSELIQSMAALIDNMMQYRLLAMDGSQNALLNVWRSFLNIANVLLVLAFLAIIYSQATSMGLSNYGIKRMLPRLVLVAIAMNISFYICAFAVDLSNIAGNSIMGIFSGLTADIGGSFDYNGDGPVQRAFEDRSGPDGLQMAFGGLLAAGIAAVVLLAGGLVPVVLGLLIVFCSLVGRQVIITILTVIAPLAFAAWLLPNTEQYFKKWWQLYSQMLFAYPMVMAVFGAAIFVAGLIQEVNQVQSNVDGAEIGGPGIVSTLVPLLVLAIPLFFIPKLIMSTNSIIGKIGSAANSVGKRFGGDALDGRMKEARQNTAFARGRAIRKEAKKNYRNRQYADRLNPDSESLRSRYTRRASRGVGGNMPWRSKATDEGNRAVERAAYGAAAKAKSEDVQIAESKFKDQFGGDHGKLLDHIRSEGARSLDGHEVEAAIGLMAKNGGSESIQKLVTEQGGQEFIQTHGTAIQDAVKREYGSIKETSPDVAGALAEADFSTATEQSIKQTVADHDWSEVGAGNLTTLDPAAAARASGATGAKRVLATERDKAVDASVSGGKSMKPSTRTALNGANVQ